MLTLALFGGLIVFAILVVSLPLWWGGRRQGLPRAGYGRALQIATTAVCLLLLIHALAIHYRAELIQQLKEWTDWTQYEIASLLLLIAEGLAVVILCWILALVRFGGTLWRAFLACLPAWLVASGVGAVAFYMVRGYVIEPMRANYGAMCPTLLGRSQCTDCPECGGVAYTPWVTDRRGPDAIWGRLCICSDCRHGFHHFDFSPEVANPDSFIVNKLLKPRRWDMVLYRATHLADSSNEKNLRFVKRVVGLPGEEVVIKEGRVYINGERQIPPPEIAGLRYLDRFEGVQPIAWGSTLRSARLGEDEYFVVGDYSYRSNDSRTWSKGVEGYSPFALPGTHIEGVVDLRYAPFHRWRVFR
jgi:signal peptidase I